MRVAVIGSREVRIDDLGEFLPQGVSKIISGGARGIDKCASEYAKRKGIPLTEYLPEYNRYGRGAPFVRNRRIVDEADIVIAFWDGVSKGTSYVIEYCKKTGKDVKVFLTKT